LIYLIDNYDSFTYNLYDLVAQQGLALQVIRNDALTLEEWRQLPNMELLIISPGPGRPEDAGILMPLLAELLGRVPVLGICLGQQAIAQHYGVPLEHAEKPMHGKTSVINLEQHAMYQGMGKQTEVMRYHSLIVSDLPAGFQLTACSAEGEIMSFAHPTLPILAMQYHPESILTGEGSSIMKNCLRFFGLI
jgi:anthranilate synthase/aminodeoxychorismate synthase-like glutamine amidotransferase